tara:strand:- start:110795 stop:111325 length:531 start_codon:yes stop_codon:yes gene_type:complete
LKLKNLVLLFCVVLLFACSSNSEENECTKEIIVQYGFTIRTPSGTTSIPQLTQEVPCDFPEPTVAQTIQELPRLQNFSYQILSLNVVPDTGNNTSRIEYSVQLNNLSNENVKGIPYITTRVNNQSFTASAPNNSGCLELQANSSCILNYSVEESHSIAIVTDYVIENVEYLIYNSL